MPYMKSSRRVLSIGGLLLLIPIGFSIILSLGRHEGAVSTTPSAVKVVESPPGIMSDIPAAANTALVKYIDALTEGLHTGSALSIKGVSEPGCDCRIIGDSFEVIYTKANLVGGAYSLKQSTIIKQTSSEIELKVVIHMSDTTHIIRKTGVKELWKGTDISAYFTIIKMTNVDGVWKIRQTSVKP
jgi:hypothetical protein